MLLKYKHIILTYILSDGKIQKLLRRLMFSINGTQISANCQNNNIHLRCHMKNTKLKICGKYNNVFIDEGTVLNGCKIEIKGNNNNLHIGRNNTIRDCSFGIIDNRSSIIIGNNGSTGETEFVSMEGNMVFIGDNFMFAKGIRIRNGDSHSILNNLGERINAAKDVFIGKNVWLASNCIILKGSRILDNSIVAAGAVVTKSFDQGNIILSGCPAQIKK